MIASTYWLPRKISSSSLSRLQVVDHDCTAAPSAMTATASATMKMIRMVPDSLLRRCARDKRCLPYGACTVNCMGLLWKPPPWVVTMASAWQLFGGFALLLQLVGHVPPSGVNLEGASPFASVVTAEFTKEPLSSLPLKTLFCSLKRRTIPWMPLPVPSTALATKHNVWPQLVRPKFGLQPLLLKSVFRRIELRFPDTVLIVSVPEAAPDLAVTVAVVEVMRSTVAFPNLSVRIGMLAASIGFAGLPRNSRPAVLLKRTSCPGSGKPSSLATV